MKKSILLLIVALALSMDSVRAQLPAVTLKTLNGTEVCTDTLSNNGKGQPLTVTIEGNSLTVYITDDTSVTFVAK